MSVIQAFGADAVRAGRAYIEADEFNWSFCYRKCNPTHTDAQGTD